MQGKGRKSITKTRLDFSASVELECDQNPDIPTVENKAHRDIKSTEDKVNVRSKFVRKESYLPGQRNLNYLPTDGATEPNKRIHILGDQQLKRLSAAIIKSRKEKWNDVYKPSSLIMTDATSTEILMSCDNIASDNLMMTLSFWVVEVTIEMSTLSILTFVFR